MTSRKASWIALTAMTSGAVLWFFWPRTTATESSTAHFDSTGNATVAPAAPFVARTQMGASENAPRSLQQPDLTPAVERVATAEDGFVEVRVAMHGKPVVAARLRLYLRGPADLATRQSTWRLAGAAETGSDGVARLPARPGAYLAVARAAPFASTRSEFRRAVGEPVTRIAIDLQPGVSLDGRTVQKGTRQEPVPFALVTLTPDASAASLSGIAALRMMRPATTDAPSEEETRVSADEHGHFRVAQVAPGFYRATAYSLGYGKVRAGVEAPAAKEIILEMAASAFVEGHVVAADGKPASGAEVFAIGGGATAIATTGDSGSFSLEVPPGTWNLAARRGNEAGRTDAPVPAVARETARGVKIVLSSAAAIAGMVVVAASHQPIAGAHVSVVPHGQGGDAGRAITDQTGNFLVTGLAPGSYDLGVTAGGYSKVIRSGLAVANGQRFPLRVELHSTGSLEGVVRDAAGRPVSNTLAKL